MLRGRALKLSSVNCFLTTIGNRSLLSPGSIYIYVFSTRRCCLLFRLPRRQLLLTLKRTTREEEGPQLDAIDSRQLTQESVYTDTRVWSRISGPEVVSNTQKRKIIFQQLQESTYFMKVGKRTRHLVAMTTGIWRIRPFSYICMLSECLLKHPTHTLTSLIRQPTSKWKQSHEQEPTLIFLSMAWLRSQNAHQLI